MKEKIVNVNMDKYIKIMIGFSLLFVILIGLFLFLLNFWWIIFLFIFWFILMYVVLKIEKIKKDENI